MKKIYWILLIPLTLITYPIPGFPTTILLIIILSKIIGKEKTDKMIKKIKDKLRWKN